MFESILNHILTIKHLKITVEYTYGLPRLLLGILGHGIQPIKYKMLKRMDSFNLSRAASLRTVLIKIISQGLALNWYLNWKWTWIMTKPPYITFWSTVWLANFSEVIGPVLAIVLYNPSLSPKIIGIAPNYSQYRQQLSS